MRENILKIFRDNNNVRENKMVLILFLRLIGSDKFKINNSRYAEPAIHAGII
jgi:hypothetical protein